MSTFDNKRWSKRELLELMLVQKKEIYELERQIRLLKKEMIIREKRRSESIDLVRLTNKINELTNKIDQITKNIGVKEKG